MTDIAALIERLESLEGPDRDIDAEIAIWGDPDSLLATPYTSSIDAAITLVPEGWSFLHIAIFNADLGDAEAMLNFGETGGWHGADHAYPAIALCIAALKARQEAGP